MNKYLSIFIIQVGLDKAINNLMTPLEQLKEEVQVWMQFISLVEVILPVL